MRFCLHPLQSNPSYYVIMDLVQKLFQHQFCQIQVTYFQKHLQIGFAPFLPIWTFFLDF